MTFLIRQGRHYPRAWDLVRALGGFLTAGLRGPMHGTVTVSQGMVDAVRWTDAPCAGDASKIVGRTHGLLTINPRRGSTRLVWREHPHAPGAVQFGYMTEDASGFTFDWRPEPYAPGGQFPYRIAAGWGWPCLPYVGGDCPARADCPVTVEADGFARRLLTVLGILALLVTLIIVFL